MRIDPKEIPGLRDLAFDSPDSIELKSALPTQSLIDQAWGNPDIERFADETALGEALVTNTARATRWIQGIAGIKTGIPSTVLPGFEAAVGGWGSGANWQEYGLGLAESGMDFGLEAMGATPIIGWAAKISMLVIKTVIALRKADKPKPQLLRYSKEADRLKASEALQAYYRGDARSIFMPPRHGEIDSWKLENRGDGYAMAWEPTGTGKLGMGVLPGYGIVVGELRSQVRWNKENFFACSGKRIQRCTDGVDRKGHIDKRGKREVANGWRDFYGPSVESLESVFPSLQRVGAALWASLSSNRTAAIFDLDTRGLRTAWYRYADSMTERAEEALDDRRSIDEYIGYRALRDFATLRGYGYKPAVNSIGAAASEHIIAAKKLQDELLDTLVVAYASKKQAAFGTADEPTELREKLDARRRQLLVHPARWRVALEDVPDKGFRKDLAAATAGPRPLSLRAPDGEFDREPRRMPPVAVPEVGESGGGGGLAIAAGAAALAFLL